MTDDIVARLRQPILVDVHPVSLHAKTMQEAADCIERLRAELAAALGRMSKLDFERTAAELERDALRALLREALEWIVEGKVDFNDALADRINAALNKGDRDE